MLKWIFKKPEKTAADRGAERFDVTVRVKSRQLPGYRALTLDISGTGLQLETEDLLEKGQVLNLEMEFDRDELPDFHCPAEVMWVKGEVGGREFLAGLAFRPDDDESRLNLARMGTVLDTRSDANIQDLLAEANKLDATREAFFNQKNLGYVPPSAEKPAPTPAPEPEPPIPSTQGVLIPMTIQISGYQWNRAEGHLSVHYLEGQDNHVLHFPECQMCHDHGCGVSQSAAGLLCGSESASLAQVRAQRGGAEWKHYRFLGPQGETILDIISKSCQA